MMNRDGETPFTLAVKYGSRNMVDLLIENGAHIGNTTSSKVLLWAVENDNEKFTNLLIDNGADVKIINENGQSLLHLAASKGFNDEFVELLIKKGVNTSLVDDNGNTALHLAAENGNARMVELIIRGPPVAIQNETEKIAGDIATNMIVNSTEYVSAQNLSTNSNITNTLNETILKRLPIKYKLDINLRNSDRRTPLHLAARNGNVKITEVLVQNCASLNLKEKINLRTALHFAAARGHKDIVELLLKHGVDTKLGDENSRSASELAKLNDINEIEALLKNNETSTDERNCFALHEIVSKGDIEATRELLKTNDVNGFYNYGNTPLFLAIKSDNQEMVDLLIKNGAYVTIRDDDQATALHRAVEKGNAKITELLIKNGADVNAKDRHTCTPLMRAAEHGHEEIAKLLLENGAHKYDTDRYHTSAAGWAEEQGHESLGKFIRTWKSSSEKSFDSYEDSDDY